MFRLAICSLVLVPWLAACSSVPQIIRDPPPGDVPLAEVRRLGEVPAGTQVRWGGLIVATDNAADTTWIEVLETRLRDNGEPLTDRPSGGRFLIRTGQFLDPVIYAEGRPITVVGTLEGSQEKLIGDRPLQLPVVGAFAHHLWGDWRYHSPGGYSTSEYDYPRHRYPYRGYGSAFFFGLGLGVHNHSRARHLRFGVSRGFARPLNRHRK